MSDSGPYQAVLVGTDGSETAMRAVVRAAAVAKASGARLIVAFVGDTQAGGEVLDRAVAALAGMVPPPQTRALTGDPADALLGLADAERVDLIVVGNKGMAGAQRFLLGSVPNKISHRASCDVLVAHTTG
ncbi:MAG TPA: universal stress protein [Egibacteraceae bacterium]|nr:universal stress protein [Egibacteraceae bacterium]